MSGKRIHSDELKLEIVTKYLEGNVSLKTLAKEYCVCKSDIQKWRNSYLEHGLEGICHTTRTYTGNFKVAVVEHMHNTGASQRQTAAHFNIVSHPTAGKWKSSATASANIQYRGKLWICLIKHLKRYQITQGSFSTRIRDGNISINNINPVYEKRYPAKYVS